MIEAFERVRAEVRRVVVGQEQTVDLALIAACTGGHVLLEGPPGVAKTLAVNALAEALGLRFQRVQFTPDMLPSDVTGTMTLRAGELAFRPGPVFTNVLLADEINRTPPKTQAALLEAMQERQVTVDGESRPLPAPFLVAATQNPIEYEGTYPLPEAQLDRFLFRIDVGYPDEAGERAILRLGHRGVRSPSLEPVAKVAGADDLSAVRRPDRRHDDLGRGDRLPRCRGANDATSCPQSSSARARVPPCICLQRRAPRRAWPAASS